jgi:hypothetical protein
MIDFLYLCSDKNQVCLGKLPEIPGRSAVFERDVWLAGHAPKAGDVIGSF